ncbi:MAG: hypothetical protein LDLANPLL_02484 [Turneriella sp.]|nr:hypothetical protein [Turneriella sp.]
MLLCALGTAFKAKKYSYRRYLRFAVFFVAAFSLYASPQAPHKSAPPEPKNQIEKKNDTHEKSVEKKDSIKEEKKKDHTALIERIREVLKYGNSLQVRDTLNTLSRLSADEQKQLLPELKKTCKSKDPLVLRKMAEFIGSASFHDLDDTLAVFLDDKNNDQLFFSTVGALAKKKPESARGAILREVKEQDFTKAGNRVADLIHLLSVYKDYSLEPFLLEKLQTADTYSDYRSGILKYLAESSAWSATLKDHVMKIFEDEAESLTVRGSAAYALGKAQIHEAKAKLKKVLTKIEAMESNDEKKRYTRFRMQIISGLILLKDDEVKDILFAMARDDDEMVRLRAVRQIGILKIPDARPLLEYKSKYDPSIKIQREAKKALNMLDKNTESERTNEE